MSRFRHGRPRHGRGRRGVPAPWRAAAPLFAGAFAACLWVATAGAGETRTARVEALTTGLERWLDRNAPYPRRPDPPRVRFVEPAEAARLHGAAERRAGRLRGLYDAGTATIYLVEPWSPRDPEDVGALLHELVHHRQEAAKHWYCDAEQEWDAYRLQERWLAGLGIDPGFYWPAIALESSCTVRDVHPD